ncbi:hypothetical protein P7M35_23100 [Vibrio parahaemolyticus]|nr:hypothetical protein [Vibrio parahaemolyticus]
MAKVYKKKIEQIENLFRESFRETSMLMGSKLEFEKSANHSNLDSGISLEDYFREEFSKFVPNKYSVCNATIVDKENYTCGDCDFVIYDDKKSVFIKRPSTENSRRKFLFHESTYGVIEVKQKLTLGTKRNRGANHKTKYKDGTLHKAMEKLFSYKQLERDPHCNDYVVAIKTGTNEGKNLTNQSFTYAFFYDTDIDLDNELKLDELISEFYWLNVNQPVEERVNGIFVLNKFLITWKNPDTNFFSYHPPALDKPTVTFAESKEDTLYMLYILLANVLRISEVTVPIFNRDYGGRKYLKEIPGYHYSGE